MATILVVERYQQRGPQRAVAHAKQRHGDHHTHQHERAPFAPQPVAIAHEKAINRAAA